MKNKVTQVVITKKVHRINGTEPDVAMRTNMVILGAYEGPFIRDVWVADSRTGELRPMKDGESSEDRHIAFATNKEGAKRFHQNMVDYVNKAFE